MLRSPQYHPPTSPAFWAPAQFRGSNLTQDGGPHRTKGVRVRADQASLTSSVHSNRTPTSGPSIRYTPYPTSPPRTNQASPSNSIHWHLPHPPASSNGSSTLCSSYLSENTDLTTVDQQSSLLCGVRTSATLPLYKPDADKCLPEIQVCNFPTLFSIIYINVISRILKNLSLRVQSSMNWSLI